MIRKIMGYITVTGAIGRIPRPPRAHLSAQRVIEAYRISLIKPVGIGRGGYVSKSRNMKGVYYSNRDMRKDFATPGSSFVIGAIRSGFFWKLVEVGEYQAELSVAAQFEVGGD